MRVAYLPVPVLVLVLVPLWSPLARVSSAAERASKLMAVPRAAEVTLDGDLSDWDLSATLESAYEPALAPRFSARFAAMYDESALYLSARMVDESPLRNRFDPHVNAQEAWRGDCLQVRLNTDPTMVLPLRANEYDARRGDPSSTDSRIVHITMWWFTDRSEPCVTIDYGFDFHGRRRLVGRDAPVAFRVDQDGGGYTLEARLPWALLAAQPGQRTPHSGDRVALTLQPLWGDAAGDRLVLNYNEVETAKGFHFQSAAGWGVLEFSPTGNLAPAVRVTQPTAMAEPLEIRLPIADSDAVQLSAAVWSPEGVLFSTPGGNAVGRRVYYYNQETQITQDLPSEVRLQPANWGTLRAE